MPAKRIRLDNETYEVLLPERTIQKRINELAKVIGRDYKGKDAVALCILNGAFFFYSDLLRALGVDFEVAFLPLSSYGKGKRSSGKVRLAGVLPGMLKGKDVLVVEDIVDSGNTAVFLEKELKKLKVKSFRIASLLLKEESLKHDVKIAYVGFKIPNDFVIGYGLDYKLKHRSLRDVYRQVPSGRKK